MSVSLKPLIEYQIQKGLEAASLDLEMARINYGNKYFGTAIDNARAAIAEALVVWRLAHFTEELLKKFQKEVHKAIVIGEDADSVIDQIKMKFKIPI